MYEISGARLMAPRQFQFCLIRKPACHESCTLSRRTRLWTLCFYPALRALFVLSGTDFLDIYPSVEVAGNAVF